MNKHDPTKHYMQAAEAMTTEKLRHQLAQVYQAYNSHVRKTCVCLVPLTLNVMHFNVHVADLFGWHNGLVERSEV